MALQHNLPIKGFIETSFVDWHGKLCAVIVLPHCNFRCRYCHNTDLVLRPEMLQDIDFGSILKRLAQLKGWVDGVCISGGEPTLHTFLPDILAVLKQQGFLTKLDTNGSSPTLLQALIDEGLVDYVAMDIKSSLDEDSYCNITQTPHMLKTIKKSINILKTGTAQHEFRFTVVPSLHYPEDVYRVAKQLNGAARLRIQNFNPQETLDPDLKSLTPLSDKDIAHIQKRVDQLISIH